MLWIEALHFGQYVADIVMKSLLKSVHQRYLLEPWLTCVSNWRVRGVSDREPIFVYQMGKVGSNQVCGLLETCPSLGSEVYHIHTLNPATLENYIARQRSSPRPALAIDQIESRALIRATRQRMPSCRVITLVREPISRAISLVFEAWKKYAPDAMEEPGKLNPDKMLEAVSRQLAKPGGVADPSAWFESELNAVLGVDVFRCPLGETGYSIISEPYPTLVIRLEDLDSVAVDALEEFLGIRPTGMIGQANSGATKWYGEAYQEVKRRLRLPESTLDRICGTRYFSHFYSDRVDAVRRAWGEEVK